MAGSVNKVILIGNVGKDPEIRNTQSGSKLANLTLATSESWNDKASGERKEKTEWHRVVVYDERLVDVVEKYVKKGRKLYLEGTLQTRKWTDQSGQEKYTTEVVLDRFRSNLTLLDSSGRDGGEMGDSGGYQARQPARAPAPAARSGGAPSWEPNKANDLDDDIPF